MNNKVSPKVRAERAARDAKHRAEGYIDMAEAIKVSGRPRSTIDRWLGNGWLTDVRRELRRVYISRAQLAVTMAALGPGQPRKAKVTP